MKLKNELPVNTWKGSQIDKRYATMKCAFPENNKRSPIGRLDVYIHDEKGQDPLIVAGKFYSRKLEASGELMDIMDIAGIYIGE